VQHSETILQQLSQSQIYRDYERAFSAATRLPLALRPEEIWHHALSGQEHENPFCALLAKASRSCAQCLQIQEKLTSRSSQNSQTVPCFAGLYDTAVPLQIGTQVIGYLQTGQVAFKRPNKANFSKIAKQLIAWGVSVDLTKLEDAYLHSRVLERVQYEAMIRLLEIFAQHLSVLANQILTRQSHAESPMVASARQFIHDHSGEDLPLEQIAKAMNVSTFYFCKMFKKSTGLTFTDYLARTRIEKAKNLLLNPNMRVSEAAYECGFVSLTHFNRVFKRVTGLSPTAHRRSNAAHCQDHPEAHQPA
jgi:AraC-like DNA-binding protein/ligand-binding sensor protein